jgi:hypothetical protein
MDMSSSSPINVKTNICTANEVHAAAVLIILLLSLVEKKLTIKVMEQFQDSRLVVSS